MSGDVVFENDPLENPDNGDFEDVHKKKDKSAFVRVLLRTGIVHSKANANLVLLIIAFSAFSLSGYFLWDSFRGRTSATAGTIYIEDLTDEQREFLPEELLKTLPSRNR